MSGRIEGKVALVLGGGRGIGAGIAERLAAEGAKVMIGDWNAETGAATAKRLGAGFRQCNIAEKGDIQAIVGETLERHGRIDIMCQNAGIFPQTDLIDIPVEEWDQVMAVNLRGGFLSIQAVLPAMREQRYGRIVLTSSITGPRVVPPGHAHYAASKAGINGLIRAAALENATYGITINGVEPGNILTEGMQAERDQAYIDSMVRGIPMGRLGTPADIAGAALFLASDDAAYVTGTTIIVDGGQLLPEGQP